MAENPTPAATIERIGDKTTISVTLENKQDEPVLRVAPDFEKTEADRKRRLEYNDRYGEPGVPGGVMSISQEKGEESIPTPSGGVFTPLGALNLAHEIAKNEQRLAELPESAGGTATSI